MQDDFWIGDWRVAVRLGQVSGTAGSVHLEPQVMKVLAYLASRPQQVVTKEELVSALWNGGVASDASVARCISRIRTALGDNPRQPSVLETIPKIGYRLVAKVRSAAPASNGRTAWPWFAVAAAAAAAVILVVWRPAELVPEGRVSGHETAAVEAYRRGRDLYEKYTYPFNQNAIAHFEAALAIEPQFALAHAGLADALVQEAHYRGGQPTLEALRHAERAVDLEPGVAATHRALGKALALNGEDAQALDAFRQALKLDPDDWSSALQSANLFFRQQRFDEAEEHYLAALRRAPNLDVAMSNLGYLYLKSGDLDAARHWFDRALALFPLQQQAASRMAMLELFTGSTAPALSRCERVVQSYPEHYACLQVLAVGALMQRDLGTASRRFERVLDAYPDDRYARLGRAKVLLAQLQKDEAVGLVDEVLARTEASITNGDAEAYDYWLLAGCHVLLGNAAEAYLWLDKAAAAGRRFPLWDESDPLFAALRGDDRFDRYIAATRIGRPNR